MRRSMLCLTMLLSISLSSGLLAGCDPKPPIVVAVKTLCTETDRYHTTDAQRAAAKANPDLWDSLFRWLAGFDVVRDKECAAK